MCCCFSVSFEGEWDSILSFPSSSPLFCLVLSVVSWILAGGIALAAWIKLVKKSDFDEDREEDKVKTLLSFFLTQKLFLEFIPVYFIHFYRRWSPK